MERLPVGRGAIGMKSTQRTIRPEGFLVLPSMEMMGCFPCCAGFHARQEARVVPVDALGSEEDLKISRGVFRLSTRMLRRFHGFDVFDVPTGCIVCSGAPGLCAVGRVTKFGWSFRWTFWVSPRVRLLK